MFIDIPPVQSALCCSGNYALCSAMLLSQSLLFSCLRNEYSHPPYFSMNSLGWLFLVSEWFGVVLVWMGLMGHQHATYSGHILPTDARNALISFALESPHPHLSLGSLNSPNGQLLAVLRLIQPGMAKTNIFRPLSARSSSPCSVFGSFQSHD